MSRAAIGSEVTTGIRDFVCMQETQCPICYGPLELREVAPCEQCGAAEMELVHFRDGRHTFVEYEVFTGQTIVLCDFCAIDFGSFDPGFFGLLPTARLGFKSLRLLRTIENPSLGTDKYCSACGYRLRFLRFTAEARRQHGR